MFVDDLRKALGAIVIGFMMVASAGAANLADDAKTKIESTCWASARLSEDPVALARSTEHWNCGNVNYTLDGERVLLRFDIPAGEALPSHVFSRRSALETVHLLTIDQDGAMRRSSVTAGALQSSLRGGYFKAPLPEITAKTRQVIVALDLPSHRMTLERAYLSQSDLPIGAEQTRTLIFLAILAGMLSMPLIFNAAFYRILREPFVLWHSVLTISLLLTIIVSSGLAVILFDPPAMTLSWMTTVIFGFTVASGAMFTHSFIEPGRLHPILRHALVYSAAWAMLMSVLHAALPFVGRPIQSTVYTAAFAPILIVFVLSIMDALRRGSRSAKFQAIGYIPVIAAGSIRLVTGVLPGLESNDAMLLFYAGCVCEVLFTTLGVADRFMSIRRQRDKARFEAELLRHVSERDTLTGLFNRRAIDQNFEQYRADGYLALAVLDLDHFKSINDVYGHSVGDAVLKAVAEVFKADPQVHAFRLGGEEFVLLLRGDDAQLKAERLRQAIPSTVADRLPQIGRSVTASMGMMNAPAASDVSFPELYRQADKLLYEAKHAGRNRAKVALAPAGAD